MASRMFAPGSPPHRPTDVAGTILGEHQEVLNRGPVVGLGRLATHCRCLAAVGGHRESADPQREEVDQ